MTVTRLPPVPCPVCHATLDAHGDAAREVNDHRPPTTGDYTVCAYCATILVFEDPQTLRRLTPAERDAVPADDDLFKVQRFFQRQIAGRN